MKVFEGFLIVWSDSFYVLRCPVSCCVQVLAAVGHQEAECRFQKLLSCLSHPPSYTCVRASTHLAPLEEIRHRLGEELKKVNPNIFWDVVAVVDTGVLINHCYVVVVFVVVVEAADVQLVSRWGGLRSDSYSPENSRCAAPSRGWSEVCEECWNLNLLYGSTHLEPKLQVVCATAGRVFPEDRTHMEFHGATAGEST